MTDPRRCTECGAIQHLERRTLPYPESGLDNVQLQNVPVWVCDNGHEEVEVPSVYQLHELLGQLILRKPALLSGREIKFLRRRIDVQANRFAERLGITPIQLSRMETGARRITKRMDLLIRLFVAATLARRDGTPFPADLVDLVEQLERAWDIGTHRLKHVDSALPAHEWEEVRG